ncbi:hypothetical protein GobsT_14360 [Gemmata obscuriglobus]|uniref:hypothetical protein n=1 Tax=Gemmata obscuriglobus TaxID=114 RepID=UPI00016C48A1|nr:hypothetical protein [Gemmata obscuriglobus]QEG26691.1 hypothetical protein GobsT_14360 [Gemmata obscuriglobus]VTS02362.1 unnamed protein product [Gemmata obscuriglobus UQM 2246]
MDIIEGCWLFLSVMALVFVSAFVHGQQLRWRVDRYRLRWWRHYDREERLRRTAASVWQK